MFSFYLSDINSYSRLYYSCRQCLTYGTGYFLLNVTFSLFNHFHMHANIYNAIIIVHYLIKHMKHIFPEFSSFTLKNVRTYMNHFAVSFSLHILNIHTYKHKSIERVCNVFLYKIRLMWFSIEWPKDVRVHAIINVN